MTFLRFIPNAVEHSELKSLANFVDTFFCYFLQNRLTSKTVAVVSTHQDAEVNYK